MPAPILFALAAFQATQALKQSEQMRQSAELQSQLNEINAQYTEYDAYQAEIFGQTEVARYQPQIDQTIGSQKAVSAYNNVDSSYGTAAEIQKETKLTGALNIIDIQNQARMNAAGLKQRARNMRQNTSVAKDQANINAEAVQTTGIINAGSTGYRGYTEVQGNSLKPGVLGKSNKTSTRISAGGYDPGALSKWSSQS